MTTSSAHLTRWTVLLESKTSLLSAREEQLAAERKITHVGPRSDRLGLYIGVGIPSLLFLVSGILLALHASGHLSIPFLNTIASDRVWCAAGLLFVVPGVGIGGCIIDQMFVRKAKSQWKVAEKERLKGFAIREQQLKAERQHLETQAYTVDCAKDAISTIEFKLIQLKTELEGRLLALDTTLATKFSTLSAEMSAQSLKSITFDPPRPLILSSPPPRPKDDSFERVHKQADEIRKLTTEALRVVSTPKSHGIPFHTVHRPDAKVKPTRFDYSGRSGGEKAPEDLDTLRQKRLEKFTVTT